MRSNGISVISNRRHISLPVEDILYIQLAGRRAVIHASGGRIYETYTTIEELEQMLGSGFIRTDRATLVAAKGIHAIGRQIELINGETLDWFGLFLPSLALKQFFVPQIFTPEVI